MTSIRSFVSTVLNRKVLIVCAAAAGILSLWLTFEHHHRKSYPVSNDRFQNPEIALQDAENPANQLAKALLDERWLKVERFVSSDESTRRPLRDFRLSPNVKALTNADCSSGDIAQVLIAHPSTRVFSVNVFLKEPCYTASGKMFTSVQFYIGPRGQSWFFAEGTRPVLSGPQGTVSS
jgi:hypothetical protein